MSSFLYDGVLEWFGKDKERSGKINGDLTNQVI